MRFIRFVLLVALVQGLGSMPSREIARAAPAVPPERYVMLLVRGALVDYFENSDSYNYYYPQKGYRICIGTASVGDLAFSRGIVSGPLELLGLKATGETPDGNIVLKNARGQAVVIRDRSPEVTVDGKRVQLEDKVILEGTGRLIGRIRWGPLNTLAPLVGYQLKSGALRAVPGEKFPFWIILLRRGERVPDPVLTVQRVLASRKSWLLLLDSQGWDKFQSACGRLARTSGMLVHSQDGPWARARDSEEVGWSVSWSARSKTGVVSYRHSPYRPAETSFRAEGNSVIVKGKRYRIPPPLEGKVRTGEVFIPVEPIARALGLLEDVPHPPSVRLRMTILCAPQCQ